MTATTALEHDLRSVVGPEALADTGDARFRRDATESQGLTGRPDAVVLPANADEVAAVVAWCYEHDVSRARRRRAERALRTRRASAR
jgi:FAD/FMN-containing dehydrogenase